MRYWWVNQNMTFRHEVGGGYLWSPKRKANGARNAFYEFMREVAPGDVIFSFSDTRIAAIGIARSYCYESPKPTEFGQAGAYWENVGWKTEVAFTELANRIRPMNHMGELRPFLAAKYAPLRADGHGLQAVYLTEVSPGFAAILFKLIGSEGSKISEAATAVAVAERNTPAQEPTFEEWERHEEERIRAAPNIAETQREALVLARRGQGQFRLNVRQVEKACRITRVDRLEHLVASHIRPWRDSNNDARLDGENGLLLTPTVDHLFDKGFVSFENDGRLIISPVAHTESLNRMGIQTDHQVVVGSFSLGQRGYLEYHRENVLRMAAVGKSR